VGISFAPQVKDKEELKINTSGCDEELLLSQNKIIKMQANSAI
jgi:hypothetical protein